MIPRSTRPLAALVCLSEALLLANGNYAPVSLALATLALGLLLSRDWPPAPAGPQAPPRTSLLLVLGWFLLWYGLHPPAPILRVPDYQGAVFAGLALAVGGLGLGLSLARIRPSPALLGGLLALALLGGVYMLHIAHARHIDVHLLQQEAAASLFAGENPYQRSYPDLYRGRAPFPVFTEAFPYPPAQLLLSAGAWGLAGDVRWGALLAILLASGAVYALGRLRWPEPDEPAPLLLAALLAFHPRGLMVLERAWTEPWLLAALGWTAYAAARGWGLGAGLLAGLALGLKQYTVVLVFPLLLLAPSRRQLLGAAVGLALPWLPFLAWSPRALWADLTVHGGYGLREDSLSLAVPLWKWTGWQVPVGVSLALSWGLGLAALRWLPRRSPALALRTSAACLTVLWLCGPKAHLNYYYLVSGLLILALAAPGSLAKEDPPQPA